MSEPIQGATSQGGKNYLLLKRLSITSESIPVINFKQLLGTLKSFMNVTPLWTKHYHPHSVAGDK